MLQNLHTHSDLCDGQNSPGELVEAAIASGFDSLGFSSHAVTEQKTDWELRDANAYIDKISSLKKEYEGKIDIFLGCELDYFSKGLMPTEKFDYTIGAVHSAYSKDGIHMDFDASAKLCKKHVDEFFGGDSLAYARLYYETLAALPERFDFDILAHFDLITKFSEKEPSLIDSESRAYRSIALEALHALHGRVEFFEVNTGAMARGYKTIPYPAPFILDEMKTLGCKFLLTSDCHDKDFLAFGFNQAKEYLKSHGVDVLYYLTQRGFVGERI